VGRHQFWPDGVSPVDCEEVDFQTLAGYRQVTDSMLAALAARRGGTLATFDGAAAALCRASGVEVRLLGL
jgi:predicted nucleic acid-binding protein